VSPSGEYSNTSYGDYRDYRDSLKSVSGLAASLLNAFSVGRQPAPCVQRIRLWQLPRGAGRKARIRTRVPAVGIWRQAGRLSGSVISYQLWQSLFRGETGVVGRTATS